MPNADRTLDLSTDVVALTAALIDVPSQSHHEEQLADLVHSALAGCAHLKVQRFGNTIVAQTHLGRPERVLIGGHLDTVPSAGNMPHHVAGDKLFGLGSCDMKGGVAVALRLAASVSTPRRDITYVFYECEEVEGEFNGLQKLADERPELLEADLAILMEPSNAGIEAGCQGTLRAEISVSGVRAHSARSWLGDNAVHAAADVLQILREYLPRRPIVDGLEYREGLSAVAISAGVAGNVIPDSCVVTVNYRFAPDRSTAEAKAHVEAVFEGYDVVVVDLAAGARPGLDRPAAAEFVAAVGQAPAPKFGWTDVARFSAMGTPALNFGPGDPSLAHSADEHVSLEQLRACEAHLRTWLA
ncbi:MAG: succinyl-diaminopimelate desuccinylase [Candidatus Nanopelagicales bacterium]|nr:succinyl-diaminopimelate desuccinylase [Candidatus Nanopelagicales bacterium]